MDREAYDVVICGGGLAGLTLGLQLRREIPTASVAVVEKTRRPLPEACHKVGESSVELGSHYLGHVLGLQGYLDDRHLPKNGLRFFCGDSRAPINERVEMGPSQFPVVPSFQMDRGRLENDLRQRVVDAGADLLEGLSIEDIEIGAADATHRIHVRDDAAARELQARFVVDATGRRRLLQRKLSLGRPSPIDSNAAWFRVRGKVDVAELADRDAAWENRDRDGVRWLSTVHLCGHGYWVWLIPLSSGYTSIGIVADAHNHPFGSIHREDKALAWIREHEPTLAQRIDGVPLEDFRCIKNYAYLSKQVFSAERWACVGEAGLFVDPLYSPGTDLIALSNSFATELIKDAVGPGVDPARVAEFDRLYIGWAMDTTVMLDGNARVFTEPTVFATKLWWDFFHYWAYICQYFFRGIHRLPAAEHRTFRKLGERFFACNERVQRVLRVWAELGQGQAPVPFSPLPLFPSVLADRHLDLQTQRTTAETLELLHANVRQAEEATVEIVLRALKSVGPERATTLAQRVELGRWGLAVDPQRLALEDVRGSQRRHGMSTLARDMERALGRPPAAKPGSLIGLLGD